MATNPVQQPFQTAADASAAYAQGYSAMLQHIAEQEQQNTANFLQQIGLDPSTYLQGATFPADVLYGAYGSIPGQSLQQQGAAFGSAYGAMPGIFQNQLAYNAAIQNAEMAHARAMSSSGGGGSDGLTPYQMASLALRADEIRYGRERDAMRDELDWAKFQADLEEEELERQQKENSALVDALLIQAAINPELMEDPKWQKALANAAALGGGSGSATLWGEITGAREDRADAAAARQKRRQQLRKAIISEFDGLGRGVKTQAQAINAIFSSIKTQFPSLAGMKEAKVRQLIREHVRSSWPNRGGAGGGGVRGSAQDVAKFRKSVVSSARSALNAYLKSNDAPNRAAAKSFIFASLVEEFGRPRKNRWGPGLRDKIVQQIVTTIINRNQHRFKKKPTGAVPPPPPGR